MAKAVLLLALLFIAGLHLTLAADNCTRQTGCESCIANDGCGWCQSNQVASYCAKGDNGGPDVGSCAGDDLEWQFDSCGSDNCNQYPSCSDCLMGAGCGWCFDSNSCHNGQGSCENYGQDTCNFQASCDNAFTCVNCLRITNLDCTWCNAKCIDSSATCSAGTNGTVTDVANCPAGPGDSAATLFSWLFYFH